MRFLPRAQVLTLEEIARLGRCFTELGVTKLRITGGEPLVRRDVLSLFRSLGRLPGLSDLTLTTNGTQLPHFATALRDAGVTQINISLDSLRPERFRAITRLGALDKTLAGTDAAMAAGFARIKLNSVILKNRNHDETRVGFISPHTHNFCGDCNRVRVTAEGRLLLCLGQEFSADLRRALRANPLDDEAVKKAIVKAIGFKPQGHDFDLAAKPIIFRHMNETGGEPMTEPHDSCSPAEPAGADRTRRSQSRST